ncbi:MAG: ABC transporter ATP-binding protein [Deltaproteobacteria bacterium]|nr:ABC transporter ATP-binding protein [Deltaproteobacteria bacterium]
MGFVIEIRGLSKVYPTPERPQGLKVLDDIAFGVEEGEFLTVVGPSGCGKTTLLEIMAGLRKPTSGGIYLDGRMITDPDPAIGIVFQEESTFPWLTVEENIGFGLRMKGVGKDERERQVQEVIDLVELPGFEKRYPFELSGGMRQRVSLARTIIMHPRVILMDEPFGALDEQTRLTLGLEILRIAERTQSTIALITHSINEAVLLSDRIVVLTRRPGRVKSVIPSKLAKPRSVDTLSDALFAKLVGQIWKDLREEGYRERDED